MQQSMFLREVSGDVRNVASAGSYPMALYMHSQGIRVYHTNDIDIFVSTSADMKRIRLTYRCIVLRPLDAKPWYESSEDEDFSESSGEDAARCTTWTRANLCSYIHAWLVELSPIGVSSPYDMHRWCELQRTAAFVNYPIRKQACRIVPSDRIAPVLHTKVPRLLRTVNIILVEARTPGQEPEDFPSFICRNFGIITCGISLHVQADLGLSFRDHDGSLALARQKTIRLRECAFACQETSVEIQMRRLWKYVQRGLGFECNPHALPADTLTSDTSHGTANERARSDPGT